MLDSTKDGGDEQIFLYLVFINEKKKFFLHILLTSAVLTAGNTQFQRKEQLPEEGDERCWRRALSCAGGGGRGDKHRVPGAECECGSVPEEGDELYLWCGVPPANFNSKTSRITEY